MATQTKQLLIVAHAPSPNTQKLLRVMLDGANVEEITGVQVAHVAPLAADAEDLLLADAVILATTENFGYMSGALKDFFDRVYYPCLEKTQAMPYALVIRAGMDGTGTQRAVESIVSGMQWKPIRPALILRGDYRESFERECADCATWMAAALEAGII